MTTEEMARIIQTELLEAMRQVFEQAAPGAINAGDIVAAGITGGSIMAARRIVEMMEAKSGDR